MELYKSISLSKESKDALYLQLYEKLKTFITNGTLVADCRLPSVRQLSNILKVNQITVVSAFKMLEKEGYVYSKPGSGTYVANMLNSAGIRDSSDNIFLDELYQQDDIPLIINGQINISDRTVNFASATPTPDLFPVENFKLVLNEVLERDKGNAFGYQDSHGYYPLRECICEVLQNSGIRCTTENIQIISGAQQGIDIISKTFLREGDFVITESPTYTGAIAVFKSRGAEIIDIELDEDGPNLSILEHNLRKYKPRLIYTIPSFQNPTGYSYSNSKRLELLMLAEKYDCYIIEDDYVSDLDFEKRNYIPLKASDKNSRVIFIKSFSKLFMPGLRLGFMIVPANILSNVLEAKHTTDISTSGLIQRAFDLYIRKGYWDKHFKFMYEIYKERYVKTIKALDEYLPAAIHYSKPGGGLNIWLNMPYGFIVPNLLRQAASDDIVFAPGSIFYSNNAPQKLNNIRLSFASVYTDQIGPGIKKLCEIISSSQHKQEAFRNMQIL